MAGAPLFAQIRDLPRLKAEAARPVARSAGTAAIQALLGQRPVDGLPPIRYPAALGQRTAALRRQWKAAPIRTDRQREMRVGGTAGTLPHRPLN